MHFEQKLRQKLLKEPALSLEVVGLQAPEPPLGLEFEKRPKTTTVRKRKTSGEHRK